MSYQEDLMHSGQPRPASEKTAPPNTSDAAQEFKQRLFDDFKKRLLTLYQTDGIRGFREAMNLANLLLVNESGWASQARELTNSIEQNELMKQQQQKLALDRMTTLMQQSKEPSQINFNNPLILGPLNEITGNGSVTLKLPNHEQE